MAVLNSGIHLSFFLFLRDASVDRCKRDRINLAFSFVVFWYMLIRTTWQEMDTFTALSLTSLTWFLSNRSQITQTCQFGWDLKGVPLLTFHHLNFIQMSDKWLRIAILNRWLLYSDAHIFCENNWGKHTGKVMIYWRCHFLETCIIP